MSVIFEKSTYFVTEDSGSLLLAVARHGQVILFLGLFLKGLIVPFLEFLDQFLLLIINSLLSEPVLLLKVFELIVSLSVVPLQFLELSQLLELGLVDDLGLITAVNVIEAIRVGRETRMELLGEGIPCLLLILNIEEAFDLVNLLLDGIDLLRFHLKLLSFSVESRAALDDLLLNSNCTFGALVLAEGRLLVDWGAPLYIGVLPLAHTSQHSILFLL